MKSCYNDNNKGQGKAQKTRKGKNMKTYEYKYTKKIVNGYEYGYCYITAESKREARRMMKAAYPEYTLGACISENKTNGKQQIYFFGE